MLILGKAATTFARKEIVYCNDLDAVKESYGDSELTDAYEQAKSLGAPYVSLMNLMDYQDYFDVIEALKQTDFTYIVFASLLLSDTFIDSASGGRHRSMLAYLLGYVGRDHITTFIVTDKHASLYEDIDAFLKDMHSVQDTFLKCCSSRADLQNLIFVGNNLSAYKNAAVVLAAMLCATPVNEYPVSTQLGESIFHIDWWDEPGDMAYFRSNVSRETAAENLLNMKRETEPDKVVFIDRIEKYLRREMDFSEFRGRPYTKYQKLLFSQKLTNYLDSLVGFILREYSIKSIEVHKDMPGTVIMLARIEYRPINCLEICSLNVEVEV